MRCVLLVALLLSLAVSVLGGGARFPTFSSRSPLPSVTLPAKYETLPEETLPTKMLPDVVNTKYIDQEIIQASTNSQTRSTRLPLCDCSLSLPCCHAGDDAL